MTRLTNGERSVNGHASNTRDPAAPCWTVEVEIDVERPRLELRADADKDVLPLARQALQALVGPAGAGIDTLHDAELALTEACANAVCHAYPYGEGTIDVDIDIRGGDAHTVVRDHGRGMPTEHPSPRRVGGLGLKVIEAIARRLEIRSAPGLGTEVVMDLPLAGAAADAAPAADVELLVRQLVAIAATQADLPATRLTEAMMAAEIVARQTSRQIVGSAVRVRIERDRENVTLFLGPLIPGGARRILTGADVPGLGPIVERLADTVWDLPPATGRASDGEELALRFAA